MKVRSQSLRPCVARGLAFISAAVLLSSAPSIARAAGLVGTGTAASCTDAALNAALAGGGLVTFNCGGLATIDISTGTGTKTIAADTTVDGGGLVTISGGNSVGVFSVNTGVEFTVQNVTIANGNSAEGGGVTNVSGSLTVSHSTFTGNSLSISNVGGLLTVSDSTFRNNSLGISNGGLLTVSDSTFTGNSSGGISNLSGGSLTVSNCTFTDNCGGCACGGIFLTGNQSEIRFTSSNGNTVSLGGSPPLTVTNSTFTGGGIEVTSASGAVLLRNTLLANSSCGGNCFGSLGYQKITDGGHNLDDGTSCGFSTANDSLSNTNPQLDPARLQDNGGPTQTVALCTAVGVPAGCTAVSPAIDAGNQAVCAAAPVNNMDQRGFLRPGIGHTNCSIGAYEADATAAPACTGDCDGGGSVTVDEVITLVNMALGNVEASACAHSVPSGAAVDVTMIIQTVKNALNGCGSGQ